VKGRGNESTNYTNAARQGKEAGTPQACEEGQGRPTTDGPGGPDQARATLQRPVAPSIRHGENRVFAGFCENGRFRLVGVQKQVRGRVEK
jgi:hypothetical protein